MDDRVAVNLERLKKRRDFLAVKKGARSHGRAFSLQARNRQTSGRQSLNAGVARFGITVTKKTGNSVVRNRIRRRLREAIRLNAAGHAKGGRDYVLIARNAALTMPFDALVGELIHGLGHVDQKKPFKPRHGYPISRPMGQEDRAK